MGQDLDYRLLFESVPGLYLVLDPDFRIVAASEAYLAATMRRRNDIIGRYLFEVFPDNPDDPAATGVRNVTKSLETVIRTGRPDTMPVQKYDIRRPEEQGGGYEERYWSPVSSPVFQDGQLAYIIHRAEDVTAFVRLEQQSRDQEKDITEQVEARRAVEAVAERLRQADRAKDEFIAIISHELRTPMTSILGWTRMLALGDLDEQTHREALDALDRSTRAQARLIEDLLDESRIASGKLRLDLRPVEIYPMVEEAVRAARPSAEAKDIRLSFDATGVSCDSVGDPARLQQVIGNVIGNAIKFTPERGSVVIRSFCDGGMAVIEVRDSGVGISPELLPWVFDRFRQGAEDGERKSGLGLGLAIARHLVEMHGGSMSAASEGEGKGATFTIRLPLNHFAPAETYVLRDPERFDVLPPLDGVRVLVIEDETDTRKVLAAALERCGAEIRCSTTASAVGAILEQWSPDVVVCDIALPDRDGCALLEDLRGQGHTFPALALTVFGRPQEQARIEAAGFDVFRQKPIDPVDLAYEINRLVRRESVAASE